MSYQFSRGGIAPLAIEDEGAIYGTYPALSGNYGTDPVIAPANDGILTSDDNVNPFQLAHATHDLRIVRASLSPHKHLHSQLLWEINFSTLLQGGSGIDVEPRNIDVFTSCGIKSTVNAATNVTLTPAAISEQHSATIACEYDGKIHEANGCLGNLILSAAVGEHVRVQWQGMGLYQDPQHGTMNSVYGADHATDALNAAAFVDVSGTITPSGGSAYPLILHAFEYNLGNRITALRNANDSSNGKGIEMLALAEKRQPRLQVRFGLDTQTGGNLDYEKVFQDLRNAVSHAFAFAYVDAQSRTWTLTWPELQVERPRVQLDAAAREILIDYHQFSTNDNNDFTWVQT